MRATVTLALAAAASAASAAAAPPHPHIIVILADDLGWRDVGFSGSNISTPVIDRLASEGVRLTGLYGQPVCTPSRAAVLTARYPLAYGLQTYVSGCVGRRGGHTGRLPAFWRLASRLLW
jgi:arylsulfatase A-like enzyme